MQSEVQLSGDHIRVYEQAMEELARHNILRSYEDGGLNVRRPYRAEFTYDNDKGAVLEGKGGKPYFRMCPTVIGRPRAFRRHVRTIF